MSVLKTIVLVPMGLQPRAKHVLPMMLIFVRRVPVNITKLVTHALVALRLVSLEQEKRLLALRHRIVSVLRTFVLVTMVLKQRAQHVLPMVLIFVRLVPVNIIKLATPALVALRVALGKDKRLLALRHRIVFVLKTIVRVPMVMQPRAQHVLPMMLIFVRRVPVNITKLVTHALDALRVALGKDKRLLALQLRIVFVLKTFVLVPMVL